MSVPCNKTVNVTFNLIMHFSALFVVNFSCKVITESGNHGYCRELIGEL